MLHRASIGFRVVTASLLVFYVVTLSALGAAHVHPVLQTGPVQVDAARDAAQHETAPTCIICFRLTTAQPAPPDEQLSACVLERGLALFPSAAAPLPSASTSPADGRAPPVSVG